MDNKFYTAKDLMKELNVSRSRAYAIIAKLNEELEQQGYLIAKAGQVSKVYADNRLALRL